MKRSRGVGAGSDSIVFQYLVVLAESQPLIWRRIQVPSSYSFWDLHVAIQDAMGWLDYHLHEFTVIAEGQRAIRRIGIPDPDGMDDRPVLAGWKVPIEGQFEYGSLPGRYVYDFGDNWVHAVVFEGSKRTTGRRTYPICLAGARRCPPEDCGGIHGYSRFLEAILDPKDPEHESYIAWAGGGYHPDDFSPRSVKFDDPANRWDVAFGE